MLDRLESEPAEFHARVRSGFLTLAAADPGRYLVVDAGEAREAVTTVIRHRSTASCRCPRPRSPPARRRAARPRRRPAARRRRTRPVRPRRSAWSGSARSSSPSCAPRRRSASGANWRRRSAARPSARRRRPGCAPRRPAAAPRRSVERLLAEEKARAEEEARRKAEEERRRKQAEEEARLRAEAEAQRLEKQRQAEEALLVRSRPGSSPSARRPRRRAGPRTTTTPSDPPAPPAARQDADEAVTVPTPVVTPTNATGGPVDETAVLPRVRDERVRDEDGARDSGRPAPADAEVTTELPRPQVPGAADETAVLPPVVPGAADETAVLPPGARGRARSRGRPGRARRPYA
ncbi:hypothetical protein SALBM217S_08650 [Streptomyces griseoloalbus]